MNTQIQSDFVFIVPLKSKSVSRSWQRVQALCERTLRSICSQTDDAFRVIVICNQRPSIDLADSRIEYVEVDFEPAPDVVDRSILEFHRDQTQRIEIGFARAKCYRPRYVMVVDADDCISRHIVRFARENAGAPGWYAKQGYIYREGSRFLFRKRHGFNQQCGTCLVLSAELMGATIVDDGSVRRFQHSLTKVAGESLEAMPFPAAIYAIANGENFSMTEKRFGDMRFAWRSLRPSVALRRMRTYVLCLLSGTIRENFGLYEITSPG